MYTILKAYSKESFLEFRNKLNKNEISSKQYVYDFFTYENIEITMYENLTVMLKGNISYIKDEIKILVDKKLYVGIDEVGVGENIGPMVVCATNFDNYENKFRTALASIKDSKKMTYDEINSAAKIIKEYSNTSCIIIPPEKFNEIYPKINNMKALNALIQNDLNIEFKNKPNHIGDEFVNSNKYFEYLDTFNAKEIYKDIVFTPKAEEKYLEVACAAIVAKSEYNKWLVSYLDKNKIPYKIGRRLSSNLIWEQIKKGEIIINDRNSLIKSWKKNN